jgi:hypothetical protein
MATFAGPLLGGGITQALTWHWIFWINVPVGLALLLLIPIRVPESYGPRRAVDLPGVAVTTAALVAIAWGLIRAANAGWAAPDVAASIAVGVVLAVSFVRVEQRSEHPMVDIALFRVRSVIATNVTTACHSAIALGAVFVMAQFLQAELGVGSFGAGVRLLPWTGSMMLVAPAAGRLADRTGDHTQLAFYVPDIEQAVAELRDRGLVFDPPPAGGPPHRHGIVDIPGNYPSTGATGERAIWFHDSEGNLPGLAQLVRPA